jgi:hypothetical protein
MKKVLSDAGSTLTAITIQGGNIGQVPHSEFHSLEETHMPTILSQINGNDWYKTFTELNSIERATLEGLLRPFRLDGERSVRELIVLKVVHERKHAPHSNNGRVLLAIVREKLFNGKPAPLHCKQTPASRAVQGSRCDTLFAFHQHRIYGYYLDDTNFTRCQRCTTTIAAASAASTQLALRAPSRPPSNELSFLPTIKCCTGCQATSRTPFSSRQKHKDFRSSLWSTSGTPTSTRCGSSRVWKFCY